MHIYSYSTRITKEDRQKLKWHKSFIVWFTWLSGAWKSTIANELEKRFYELITSEAIEPKQQESLQLMLTENNRDETLYDLCCKVRPFFY